MSKLSPEEEALWSKVSGTVRKLGDKSQHRHDPGERGEQFDIRLRSEPLAERPTRETGQRMSGNLDSHWDRRLRNGEIAPERSLDLHGMTLDTAWQSVDRALSEAIAGKERVLLLVTGREREAGEWLGGERDRRGSIRRVVHDWLHASRHSGQIAAVREAHKKHGGAGSLYVILRRR